VHMRSWTWTLPPSKRSVVRAALAFSLAVAAAFTSLAWFAVLGLGWWRLVALGIPALLALARAAAPLLWPDAQLGDAIGQVCVGALLLVVVGLIGVVVVQFWFAWSFDLCGGDGSHTGVAGLLAGLAVLLVGATVVFLQPVRRVAALLPLVLVLAFVVDAGVMYAIPANHGGVCDS
jgi:hypothetical protein